MGDENLRAAKTLLTSGYLRGCLNRAYYSAYAAVTGELVRLNRTVSSQGRPNPAHEQLSRMLMHASGTSGLSEYSRRDLSRRLRNLRRFREVADYEPQGNIEKSMAIQCVRDAALILERLRG